MGEADSAQKRHLMRKKPHKGLKFIILFLFFYEAGRMALYD